MAILMTGLCEKGAEIIWKQCNEELFPQGLTYLEEAAYAGDAEAWFFLGHCYSWGDGSVGFNEKKAYECYKRGAAGGSARAVLGAVRAGQYDEEMKKAAALSLEESFRRVRDAAAQGEGFAAWQIGEAVEWENAVGLLPEEEQGCEHCISWYRQAAEDGIVPAMVKLGKCYRNGRYVEADRDAFLEWADRAAARGDAWGLYQMGCYYKESPQEANWQAAFQYFQAAAYQGDSASLLELGRMYLEGRGTERDVKKAVASLEAAAAREETESFGLLGDIFYRDELVERNDEAAFYWYSRAYGAGQERVARPLALLYLSPSPRQDIQKGKKLLEEAAGRETDGQACLALGHLIESSRCGRGDAEAEAERETEADVEPGAETARSWYEKGAAMGNPECMEILGCLYEQGEDGLTPDYEKAFYWLDRCEKAGTLQSFSRLAHLYMKGLGCQADEEKGRELYERAAETEGDGTALYELGFFWERKNTSSGDLERAAQYYRQAIEKGNESAARRFSHFKKGLLGKWKIIY